MPKQKRLSLICARLPTLPHSVRHSRITPRKKAHTFLWRDYVDENRVSGFTGTGRVALLLTITTLIVWPGDVFSSRALYRIAEHSSNQQTNDDCRDQNCG